MTVLVEIMQWGSVAFNGLAAFLWFGSARVFIPMVFADVGSYAAPNEPYANPVVDPVVTSIKRQAHWSALGATSAGFAAIFQAAAIWLG